MKLLKNLTASALVVASLVFVTTVSAQADSIGDFIGNGSSTGGSSLSVKRLGGVGISSVSRLISATFNVAILVAAIAVFGMLILGGYGWLTAGGDKAKVEEARTRITNALVGLAIVAAAWALINIIGQFFGVNITDIKLPTATGSNVGDTGTGGL